jgi:putative ABC transport system permease protein
MTIVETLTRDVTLALRRLIRTPGFTAIAVLSLSLGIGVNTLMFSFMNAALLQPLPYPDPSRLVMIYLAPPNNPGNTGPLPPPMFFLLRDHAKSFEAVGVYDFARQVNLAADSSGSAAERLSGHRISSTAFQALGVKPLLGRFHTPAEDLSGAEPTIVLGHALWQRHFGGRSDIVGQSAIIDGQSTAIIGVMPASFEVFDGSSDAWLPFAFAPAAAQGTQRWLRAVARLKPGVTLQQASAELVTMAREYERAFPARGQGWTLTMQPLDEAFFGGMRQPLLMLQTAVALVLLIACANLAALILTRAVSRQRELAVRAALGQSRGSIITQLMVESVLLSLAAGVVGAFVTWAALGPLVALTPVWFPRLDAVGIDARVFLFCLAVCLVASLIFGLIPALQASRPNLARTLHESSARSSGGRARMLQLQGLVVVQVALAFVLLIGAGLVIKTLVRLQGVDMGIDTSGLLSLQVQLPRATYMKENVATAPGITLVDYNPAGRLLIDRFHEVLRQTPGVVSAAGSTLPLFGGHLGAEFMLEGAAAAGKPTFSSLEMVTPEYFATIGTRLVRGRDFSAGDQANTPWVAVVNEAFARTFWPGEEALGKHLTLKFYDKDGEVPREVVGVVADSHQFRGETEIQPLIYALHRQQLVRQRASLEGARMQMAFVIRAKGDPLALAASVRAALARVDPSIPVMQMRTVDSFLGSQLQSPRFIATLFTIFAAVALTIGVIGIYGVTAHAVSDRYREFGIRRALGAGTGTVLGLVIRRSLVILLVGVGVGVGAALALSRFVENFLWGVTRSDPATFVTIAAILIGTGMVACLVPGTRATRIDPLVALRHD